MIKNEDLDYSYLQSIAGEYNECTIKIQDN